MNVVCALPPMYEEIAAVFPIRGRSIIFTWGWTIYNPDGGEITDELLEHERVHAKRQETQGGPAGWWAKYLVDPEFRLEEELPAHRAEYRRYEQFHRDRNARARYLQSLAVRLSSPLYGSVLSPSKARTLILKK